MIVDDSFPDGDSPDLSDAEILGARLTANEAELVVSMRSTLVHSCPVCMGTIVSVTQERRRRKPDHFIRSIHACAEGHRTTLTYKVNWLEAL